MTTYEFIVKNRVKPVSSAKPVALESRPTTNDRIMLHRSSDQSQGFHDGSPEDPKLTKPVTPEKQISFTGHSTPNIQEEIDSLNGADFQKAQRIDQIPKDTIIKHKPRRSGTGSELRSPR